MSSIHSSWHANIPIGVRFEFGAKIFEKAHTNVYRTKAQRRNLFDKTTPDETSVWQEHMASSTWTSLFKSRSTPPNETAWTKTNQEATASNHIGYYGLWLIPGVLTNINLTPSPSTNVPLTTPSHHESPIKNWQSLEWRIQDTLQEIQAIKQEVALQTAQFTKGGWRDTLLKTSRQYYPKGRRHTREHNKNSHSSRWH